MSWGFGLAAAGLNSYYCLCSELHLNVLQAQPNSLLQNPTGHLLLISCKFKSSKWKWKLWDRSKVTHAPLSVNAVLGLSHRLYSSTQIQFHSSVPRDYEVQGELRGPFRVAKDITTVEEQTASIRHLWCPREVQGTWDNSCLSAFCWV